MPNPQMLANLSRLKKMISLTTTVLVFLRSLRYAVDTLDAGELGISTSFEPEN